MQRGQEAGSTNGYEAANMSRGVFRAFSLTSTSFSKVYNSVKSPGMIPPPPSTNAGITVSWFSIIYPHQVEKHNPDSPFNSLSLSCSPHVIVVLRTNMSYVCEPPAANGLVLKLANLHCRSNLSIRVAVDALIACRVFFFLSFCFCSRGFLGMTHCNSTPFPYFQPLFSVSEKTAGDPYYFLAEWILFWIQTHLTHVLIRQVTPLFWGNLWWWKWSGNSTHSQTSSCRQWHAKRKKKSDTFCKCWAPHCSTYY